MSQIARPWAIDQDAELLVRCPVSGALFREVEVIEGPLRWLCPDCYGFHNLPFLSNFSQSSAKSIRN